MSTVVDISAPGVNNKYSCAHNTSHYFENDINMLYHTLYLLFSMEMEKNHSNCVINYYLI